MSTEHTLEKLWATIELRRDDPAAGAGLPAQYKFNTRVILENPSRLRKKLHEETYELNEAHQALLSGVEVDIGSRFGAHEHVAREAADVLWHLYVLLASADVNPEDVYAVMERRMEWERSAEEAAAREPVLAQRGEPAALNATAPA